MDKSKIRSCLFLDRDGVINQHPDTHYVMNWQQFYFCPGVLEAIPRLNQAFERIVIVTNQQGIGKGLMTEADLSEIHARMLQAISAFGGYVDMVLHCPELASQPDNCRKPSTRMGLKAKEKYPDIIFDRSVMVGDQLTDLQFGQALNMEPVLIRNPQKPVVLPSQIKETSIFDSLLDWTLSL